jgi:hypothetical protein
MEARMLKGRLADGSQIEDRGTAEIVYTSGPHTGHKATVRSEKHNCGGYVEIIDCECGTSYNSGENGCWQYDHQCEPTGDETLICWIKED